MASTTTKCRRCHRTLTGTSATAGIGPICARKERLEQTGYSPAQIADAEELVEIGGVIRLRGTGDRRVYLTLGHRRDVYRTAITGQCTCTAGLRGERCFHSAAVALYATPTSKPAAEPIVLPAPTPAPTAVCLCGHTAAQHDAIGCTGTVSLLPGVLPAAPCDCRQHTAAVPARAYITAA